MPTTYWVRDAYGRVLGPIERAPLCELILSGRVNGIVSVSTDEGRTWRPVDEHEDICTLQLKVGTGAVTPGGTVIPNAQKLRDLLASWQRMTLHEILRLPAETPMPKVREAFASLARRLEPNSLPTGVDPAIREASGDLVAHLGKLMVQAERGVRSLTRDRPLREVSTRPASDSKPPPPAARPASDSRPPPAGPPTPPPVRSMTPPPVSRPSPAPSKPVTPPPRQNTFRPREHATVERTANDKLVARIGVGPADRELFTWDRLANIYAGAAFIPCEQPLTLGDRVEVVFRFAQPPREISVQGSVISWSAGDARSPRGFGFKFSKISNEDRGFLNAFVAQL